VNSDSDDDAEFFVVGVDIGAVLAGSFDGRFASIVFDENGKLVDAWVAEAPMNGSTLLLPALASNLGLAGSASPIAATNFAFQVASFSLIPGEDGDEGTPDVNTFDDVTSVGSVGAVPFLAAILGPQPLTLAPGQSASIPTPLSSLPAFLSGGLGWMIVTQDDANGAAQADLIPRG
jgi:hypothetical protein